MAKLKPTRYYSNLQEKQVAKDIGGKQVVNSGATQFKKSDVLSEMFAIECKTKMTDSNSISIKKDWIDKQKLEAMSMRKPFWALAFNFGPKEENYYVIDGRLFRELLSTLEERDI